MEQRPFQYWQWPGLRWLFLAAGLLQLVNLAMKINDWRTLAGAGIFSAAEWQSYCARQGMSCANSGLLAAVFLSLFFIGQWAKSARSARRAEGVLLLGLAVVWAAAGAALDFAATEGLFWLILAALVAGGGVSLWQAARLAKTTSGEEAAI